MKKILAIALTLASVGFAASTAQAKASNSASSIVAAPVMSAAPAAVQWRNRRNRRVRVTTQSRLVRVGRRVYRETYQVRYLPNGRTQTRLISRVRVR